MEGYNIHIGGFVCKNSVREQQMSNQINGLGFFLFIIGVCFLVSRKKCLMATRLITENPLIGKYLMDRKCYDSQNTVDNGRGTKCSFFLSVMIFCYKRQKYLGYKQNFKKTLGYLSVGPKINVDILNRTDNRTIEAVLTGLMLFSPII